MSKAGMETCKGQVKEGIVAAEREIRKAARQYESLNEMMSASRYKEKVPLNVHEDNTVKLCVLRQELESFEDNIQRFTPHIDPQVLKFS